MNSQSMTIPSAIELVCKLVNGNAALYPTELWRVLTGLYLLNIVFHFTEHLRRTQPIGRLSQHYVAARYRYIGIGSFSLSHVRGYKVEDSIGRRYNSWCHMRGKLWIYKNWDGRWDWDRLIYLPNARRRYSSVHGISNIKNKYMSLLLKEQLWDVQCVR